MKALIVKFEPSGIEHWGRYPISLQIRNSPIEHQFSPCWNSQQVARPGDREDLSEELTSPPELSPPDM